MPSQLAGGVRTVPDRQGGRHRAFYMKLETCEAQAYEHHALVAMTPQSFLEIGGLRA